jgi:hypothetical protein
MSDTEPVPGDGQPSSGDELDEELRDVPDQDVAPESPTPEPPG